MKAMMWVLCVCLLSGATILGEGTKEPSKAKKVGNVSIGIEPNADEVIVRVVGAVLELGDPTEGFFEIGTQRAVAHVGAIIDPEGRRLVIVTDAMGAAELLDGGKEFTGYWKTGTWRLVSGKPPTKKEDVGPAGLVVREKKEKKLLYHEGATLAERKPFRVWEQIKSVPDKK